MHNYQCKSITDTVAAMAHQCLALGPSSCQACQQPSASSLGAMLLHHWTPCSRHPLQGILAIFCCCTLTPIGQLPCSLSLCTLHTRPKTVILCTNSLCEKLAAAGQRSWQQVWLLSGPTWKPQLDLAFILVINKGLEVDSGSWLKFCHEGWLRSTWTGDTWLVIFFSCLFLAHACAAGRIWHLCQTEVFLACWSCDVLPGVQEALCLMQYFQDGVTFLQGVESTGCLYNAARLFKACDSLTWPRLIEA